MNNDKKTKVSTHIIDAKDQVLGRIASTIAKLLLGKYKIDYVPHVCMADNVIVVNASRVVLTGKKLEQKMDFRHSGYPAGDRLTPYKRLMEKFPERVIELAVRGMLPKNKLRKVRMRKLKVYAGIPEHLPKDRTGSK